MEDSRSASGGNTPDRKDDAVLKKMSDQEIENVLKKADEQLKKPAGGADRKGTADRKAGSRSGGSPDGRMEKNRQGAAGRKGNGRTESSVTDRKKDRSRPKTAGGRDAGQGGSGLTDRKGDDRQVAAGGKKAGQGGISLTDRKDGDRQVAAGGKKAGQGGSSLTGRKDENRQGTAGTGTTDKGRSSISVRNDERERVTGAGMKSGTPDGIGLSDRKSDRERQGAALTKSSDGNDASGAIRTEGWQEPLDMTRKRKRIEPGEKITIGWVFADIMEGIWILFKLAVVVSLVTVIMGFFLTRDLCIRGRNGERLCVDTLQSNSLTAANRSDAEDRTKQWLKKAKREKLTLVADDKSILVARAIRTKKESDKWAVVMHGYNGNMEDVYDIAMRYQENGYNVLTPDLRANGESEGMFPGMGWTDRMDIINWIDVILQENPSAKVVIHGIDVGADAALMLSGESLKSSIKAIIADGAYTNAWDVVKKEYQARHAKLPVFPFMYTMNPVMKVWAGFALKDADAVSQVKRAAVPILLIRGENDTYASEDMTQELNEAIASRHEVLHITGAGHADCRFAEPETYYDKVFDFAGSYIN